MICPETDDVCTAHFCVLSQACGVAIREDRRDFPDPDDAPRSWEP